MASSSKWGKMDEPKPFQKKVLQGGNIKFNPEKVKKMADEIYCKYCGTRLEERDQFCPECGSHTIYTS